MHADSNYDPLTCGKLKKYFQLQHLEPHISGTMLFHKFLLQKGATLPLHDQSVGSCLIGIKHVYSLKLSHSDFFFCTVMCQPRVTNMVLLAAMVSRVN